MALLIDCITAIFRVCLTERKNPLAISRRVSFSEAVYDGEKEVQGVAAKLIKFVSEIPKVWAGNKLPLSLTQIKQS